MPTVKSFYRQKKKKKGAGVTKPSPSSSKTKRSGKASKTPAIESEDVYGEDEDRLRRFDMDMKYGPCIGLTRLERLQRASSMGLEPPAEVVELLRRSNPAAIECVWQGRV